MTQSSSSDAGDVPRSASFRLSILGNTSLCDRDDESGQRVLLAAGKPLALLTYLHCTPGQTVSREQLLELLWSDATPEKGRHTLRQTFWYIRRKLGDDPFNSVGDSIKLASPIPSDRSAFLAALDADDPELAVRLYTGDFFPDFAAPGGAAFEQWADLERSRLRALYLGAATRAVRDRLAKGHARDAIAMARRVHDLAPRQQAAWRLLLESCLAAGDPIGAAVELERLERWLAAEELEPESLTAQLIKSVRAGRPNGSERSSDEPETAATGLRAELVGRETEFSELLSALESAKRGQSRHLHVAGAAGLGKTRLLEGVAARLRATRTRVVSVRATPAERSLPYAFAAQLVAALVSLRGASAVSPDAARTLVALAPASSNYLNAEPDKATGDEALRRRSLALTELVSAIAHDAPLVVLVDDVHWMDAQSRTVLASLATRLADASVLLVTAARSTDRFVDDTPAARRITLAPLSVDDVVALVMSIGRLPSEPWTDAFIRALHDGSNGSPLLVLETLQLVMERDQLRLAEQAWSTPDAEALIATLGSGRAMQQRLSALPSPARHALLRLAVAGIGLDDGTLPSVLSVDGREALSLLETRGLVSRVDDRWRVAHDEIAAIAVEMASDADRILANEVIASYLERIANDDVAMLLRAAWHRARASDAPALDRVFARAVRSAQLSGEHEAIRSLGREVLGTSAETAEIDRLVGRLPWRVRHRRGGWLGGVALLASLAVLLAAFALSRGPSVAAGRVLLVMDVADGDSSVFVALPDIIDDLANDRAVDLMETTASVPPSVLDSITISGRLPDSSFVGSGLLSRDPAQGMDIVRVTPDGKVTRLLGGRHDQAGPVVSPDGRRVAYSTGELHEQQRAEVAVYAIGRDETVRLTTNDEKDFGQTWSIEGTRVAYLHSPSRDGLATICWTSADGITGACHALPDSVVPAAIVGWGSDRELFVEADNIESEHRGLVGVDVESGRWRLIDASGSNYRADPSGRLVLCTCEVKGYSEDVMAAFSPQSPERKRVLRFRSQPLRAAGDRLRVWTASSEALASIVAAIPDTVAPYSQTRLRINGFDAARRERSVPVATWRSLDTSVAVVSNAGDLVTKRAGRVILVASAGGVLTDTVTITVQERPVDVVFREDWRPPLSARWVTFGAPTPFTVGSTLRVNGDGHLTSGVLSRALISSGGGAGARARIRLPITEPQWQSISLWLNTISPEDSIATFVSDSKESASSAWQPRAGIRSCGFAAPRQEGGEFMRLATFSSAGRSVPISRSAANVADGAWHTVTLQIFTDGRCALAIDGAPVAVSRNPVVLDRPLRLSISGQSVRTIVEVGEVEAWTGVRRDIDWTKLGPNALSSAPASPLPRSSDRRRSPGR